MKIRTVYFKVTDMQMAVTFWRELLQIEPHKATPSWHEFMVGSLRLGLLLNDFGDAYTGSNCVPVWEFDDEQLPLYVERAVALGATVILDGRDDPRLRSVVFKDPCGNEFELSRFHD
jgi:catechol 2,3-dioxygenase-like lactoylglutathione lyase family enzyme